MARKMTEWPSKRGPITKIMPSDGCIGDTVPLAVGKWYDFHEFGWYMGNVGLDIEAAKGTNVLAVAWSAGYFEKKYNGGLQILYRTRFLGHKFVSCGGPE